MLNPRRFIRVLGEDAEAWAKRYSIEPFSVSCHTCGAVKTTSVPFATKKLRGLLAPPCACGDLTETYAIVPAPKRGSIFDVLKRDL